MLKRFAATIVAGLVLFACAAAREKRAAAPSQPVDVASEYQNENSYFYFLLTQLKTDSSSQAELASYLKTALEKDQKSSFLWNLKAYNEAQDGHVDAAKASARAALALNPQDADTLFLLGKIASFEKKPSEAEDYFEKAILAEPENEEVYHFLAREYYGEKDGESARRTLNKCLAALPDSIGCLYYLGSIALEEGDEAQALQSFETLIELYPEQIKVLQVLADIHLKREDYAAALEVFKKIFRLTPDDVAVQIRLGWLYYEMGDVDYAIQVFEKIRGNFPESDKVNYFLALLYTEKKESDKALAAFAKIPADSEFFKKAVAQQVVILTQQNRDKEIAAFLAPHLKETSDPWLYQFLGWNLSEHEEFAAAARYLSEGIKRFGKDEDLLFQRAIALERQGEWEAAQLDLADLIAGYPNSAKAYNFWGYTMAERGEDLTQALAYVQKADALTPNQGHILDSLGWIHFKMGQAETALTVLQKAVKLQKNEPTILEHLGDVYRHFKDKKLARDYYEQSLQALQAVERKQPQHLKQIEAIQKKLAEI